MSNKTKSIPTTDPRHEQAERVMNEVNRFWYLQPYVGAVKWIEDHLGRLVIITRREYRDELMAGVHRRGGQIEHFDLPDLASEPLESITHIAGLGMQVGDRILQRCAVCGAVLVDQQIGPGPLPSCFDLGLLVRIHHAEPRWQWELTRHDAGDELPGDSCHLVGTLEDGKE